MTMTVLEKTQMGTWPESGAFPVIGGEEYVKMRDAQRLIREAINSAYERAAEIILDYPDTDIAKLHASQAVVHNVCNNLFAAIRSLKDQG